MKVFISWSGDQSKPLAQALRDWLPTVLQAVRPYFSPDDVTKGARWTSEIAQELQASSFGILCVTPDNFDAPWLVFEAGALSKSLDKARVSPLLFGLEPTDVTGPLSQFQATRFEKSEVEQLVRAMNRELGDGALAPEVLATVFEMWWPKLQSQVASVPKEQPTRAATRSERDMLEEVLALTRSVSSALEGRKGQLSTARMRGVNDALLAELLDGWRRLVFVWRSNGDAELQGAIKSIRRPLGLLLRRVTNSRIADQFYAAAAELQLEPSVKAVNYDESMSIPPEQEDDSTDVVG